MSLVFLNSSRLLKTHGSPFESLRACPEFIEGANGDELEMIEHFPFMLSPSTLLRTCLSKHSEPFFSNLLVLWHSSSLTQFNLDVLEPANPWMGC